MGAKSFFRRVIRGIKSLLFIILFLAVIIVAIQFFLKLINLTAWHNIFNFDKQILGIIAVLATIFICVFIAIANEQAEKRKDIEQERRKQKSLFYKLLLQRWFDVMSLYLPGKTYPSTSKEEILKSLDEITRELLLWGNNTIIRRFVFFRDSLKDDGQINAKNLADFEKFLFTIRKDLGYNAWGLRRGDLLTVFLENPDSLKESLSNPKPKPAPKIKAKNKKAPEEIQTNSQP